MIVCTAATTAWVGVLLHFLALSDNADLRPLLDHKTQ